MRAMPRTGTARGELWAALVPAALALAFWLPWLAGAKVPVPADQQSRMLPWRGAFDGEVPRSSTGVLEVELPPYPQWDALWWDGVAQFAPWRMLLGRGLARGEWPLWSPAQFCGYPFVGDGQSALFYPPNWLYGALPVARGLAVVAALHSVLAALLTFAFCRRLGVGRAGAAYAGLAFACGGFMLGWAPLPTLPNCAAWLPGCLLGVEMVVRSRRPGGVAFLALCVGMAVLAGHVQIAAYVLLTTALYAAARVAWLPRSPVGTRLVASAPSSTTDATSRVPTGGGLGTRGPDATSRVPTVGRLILGLGLGIMLAGAQALPLMELARLSPRGAATATPEVFHNFHLPRALQPWELVTLWLPDALGNPARGDYVTPERVPGAAYGERCGYLGMLTLLLALGAVALGRGRLRWALPAAAGIALWGAMGGLPAALIFYGVPKLGLTGGFVRLLVIYTLFMAALGGLGLDVVCRRAQYLSPALRGLLGRSAAPLALAVLAAELFTWGWRTVPAVDGWWLYPPTHATTYLQHMWQPGDRMLAVTSRRHWGLKTRPEAVMPPNSETAYDGLESVQGYDSLAPRNIWNFAAQAAVPEAQKQGAVENPAPLVNGNMMLLDYPASPLLALAGVDWIVMEAGEETEPEHRQAVMLDGVAILRNPGAFPRAFLTQAAAPRGASSLDSLAGLRERDRRAVHGDFGAHNNAVKLSLPPLAQPQTLVVTNTFYPGWRAWLGGRELPVTAAAGTFQAVSLPAGGAAGLLLAFTPGTVTAGMFLTLLAAGLMAGIVSFQACRRPVGANSDSRPLSIGRAVANRSSLPRQRGLT